MTAQFLSTATPSNLPFAGTRPPAADNKPRWERAVPIYGVSVITPFFLALVGLAVFAFPNRLP